MMLSDTASLPDIVRTLGVPLLVFFLAQIVAVYVIGCGSSSALRRNTRAQLIGAGLAGVVLVVFAVLAGAGWALALAGGGLLLMWILSHVVAWGIAAALGRQPGDEPHNQHASRLLRLKQ